MKYLKLLILSLCLASFPLVTGMTCSTSQQRVTYNTLYTVGQAVNSAYSAYMDQVVAGKATFNVAVANAYNQFQVAFAIAVQSAQTLNAPAPASLTDLANAVYAAIKQFTK